MKEGEAEQRHGACIIMIVRRRTVCIRCGSSRQRPRKLSRASTIDSHHTPPAALFCGAIGVLQAGERKRGFGMEEASDRRRGLYVTPRKGQDWGFYRGRYDWVTPLGGM